MKAYTNANEIITWRVLSFGRRPLRPRSTHPPVGPLRCRRRGHPASATRLYKLADYFYIGLILLCIILISGLVFAQELPLPITPPEGFLASDAPNDSGGSIALAWKAAPYDSADISYQIYMAEAEAYKKVAEFPSDTHHLREAAMPWWIRPGKVDDHYYLVRSNNSIRLENGKRYLFKIVATDGKTTAESLVSSAVPSADYFNWALLNNFLLMIGFTIVVFYFISHAKKNKYIFLRKIPGLDAVDEAIGRATEMGKPILYLTGSDSMDSLSTIAATVILGEVARRAAVYGTELRIPHRDPVVMAVCQEIVKESYISAGRPDAYKDDFNFFITTDQFSYTAAVDGIMLRERPAANFYMGFYYAESLLLAETGASTGAIQIAGTDADHQLPFFVTACDYTLIGEELYAASAYLSREPVLLGTLRGQDIGKAFCLVIIVMGTLLTTFGLVTGTEGVSYLLELFKDFK